MNREYHKWFSIALQRDMELLVFGDGGRAIIFFPTRTARFFDYENWGVIEAFKDRIENGEMQLFCVDSVDAESFYNPVVHPADRIKRHLEYEKYILEEVVPLIRYKNSSQIEVTGCSMGAYHAINIALKHSEYFIKAVGMSGRYDLTQPINGFRDLFDGFEDETVYYNMPCQFMKNLDDENILAMIRKLEIILVVGETDAFLQNNRELSDTLSSKGINNQLYIWEGEAHKPRHWQKMVQLYL